MSNVEGAILTTPPKDHRVKRCSKSPHQSGPPLRLLPVIWPSKETTRNTLVRPLIKVQNIEDVLPFKNAAIDEETGQPTKALTSVDVSTNALSFSLTM